MKKHSLAEFFKSKSFYALLCIGVLATIAIFLVRMDQSSDKGDNKNLADLNEPNTSDVVEGDDVNQEASNNPDINNGTSSTTANNEGNSGNEVAENDPNLQGENNQPVTDGSLLENDVYETTLDDTEDSADSDSEQTQDVASNDNAAQPNTEEIADNEATQGNTPKVNQTASNERDEDEHEDDAQEVMSPETLVFNTKNGLLWPVSGNVLMNYSMDKVIYHKTLEQFRCSPAIIIDAEIGKEVLNASKGIVTEIAEKDETGQTVTIAIGSGYSLVYGQLKEDVKVKVGDLVEEGEIIGYIEKPSKYYSVEGSNLYFQVLKDNETVNPLSLLRAN